MKKTLLLPLVWVCLTLGFFLTGQAQVTLPFLEDFEGGGPDTTFTTNAPMLNGLSGPGYVWTYEKTNEGRLRMRAWQDWGLATPFTTSGNNAITLDDTASAFPAVISVNSLILTINMSGYTGSQIVEMDFNFANHGEELDPGDRVFIRGSVLDPWVELYNLNANQPLVGTWKNVKGVDVDSALAANNQSFSISTQFRFGQEDDFAADDPSFSDGFTFDDVRLYVLSDVSGAAVALDKPESGCGLGMDTVCLTYGNVGAMSFDSALVYYRINGGVPIGQLDTTNLNPGDQTTFCFSTLGDFSVPGAYTVEAWVEAPGDTLPGDDTVTTIIRHIPSISTFPHLEDFDSGPNGWSAGGTNSSWALTTPAGSVINAAASGTNSWVTNPTGLYNSDEASYVQSPCFDFTGILNPRICMSIWFASEQGWDGTALQSSVDGGMTWQLVGAFNGVIGNPVNWFNDNAIDGNPGGQMIGWTGNSGGYVVAQHDLIGLGGQSQVLLRVAFGSDNVIEEEGFAFDDVLVFDKSLSDASAISVLSPQSACGLGNESISFSYFNSGGGAFDSAKVEFQMNGGPITTEYDSRTLQPGDSVVYTFTNLGNFSTLGANTVKVFVTAPNDSLPFKDTVSLVVYNLQLISSFPYVEDFESGPGDWTAGGNGNWQWGLPQGTTIDTAASGLKAWATDTASNYANNECSFVLSPCFDFSSLTLPTVRANIWVNSENGWDGTALQVTTDSGQTWLTVGGAGTPNNWYNSALVDGLTTCVNNGNGWTGTTMFGYVNAEHRVTFLAGEPSVQFRFFFASDGFLNAFDGFAFDDFEIYEQPPTDGQIIAIEEPITNCSIGMDTVCISYFNNGSVPFDSAFVSYRINGGTVVTERDTATLQPGDTVIYCFNTLGNFTAIGSYSIEGAITVPGDNLQLNDSTSSLIQNVPVISTFPYDQDFENGPGGWAAGGINNSWQLGQPVGTTINAAASGTHAWVTDTAGFYNDNEASFVVSPCFDFTGLLLPILEVNVWWNSERIFDGTVLQSSIDGGQTWVNVGQFGDPNWFNDSTIVGNPGGQQVGWTSTQGNTGSGQWLQGMQVMRSLSGQPAVRFRFAFGSDGSVNNFDGFAFDDFRIKESPGVDIQALDGLAPNSGCGLGLEQIGFRYVNGGITGFDSASVSYSVNGSPFVTERDPRLVNPGDTVVYPFTALYNFSTPGLYHITIVSQLASDTLKTNDTLRFTVNSVPNISTFPYLEDFESGPGGWTAEGDASWEWGLPRGTVIDTAASGVKAWMTDTLNTYDNDICASVISPCFDFSTLNLPAVRANIWVNAETSWDGALLQSTTDSGLTWVTIGAVGDPTNWYNDASITGLFPCIGTQEGWTGTTMTGYVLAEHELGFLAGEPDVRFRFMFGADPAVNGFDGFAFDDFEIRDLPPNDVGIVQILSPKGGNCGDSTAVVSVVVKNYGSSDQVSFPIAFDADTGSTSYATINYTYNDTLRPGDLDTVILGTLNTFAGGNFTFTTYSQLSGDSDRTNDTTIQGVISILAIPAAPAARDTVICEPDTITLPVLADTNFVYTWYDSLTGGSALIDSTHLTTLVTGDTTFYVAARAKGGGNCLRITEAELGNTDFIEIQNLSSQSLDATGYFVAVSNSYSDIDDFNATFWNLGMMSGGQVMYRDDNPIGGQYWGSNLFFNPGGFPGFAGWAMIIDNNGAVVDAVFWGWPAANIANFNANINGFSITGSDIPWTGDGVNVSGLPGSHIALTGNAESDNATDWDNMQQLNSPGTQNSSLSLPYSCGGGCPSLRTPVRVTIQPLVVDLGADRAVCEGTTLDGTTAGGVSYLWSTMATTPSINVNISGQYVLAVTNQGGCVGTDTINLLVQPLPTVDLGPADTIGCGALLLDAGNPGSQYAWTSGGQLQTELVTVSGTYAVNVTNASGCTGTDTINVNILPSPLVNLGPDFTACDQATLDAGSFPAGYTFFWNTNETTQTINVSSTGLYSVVVTDTAGCTGSDDIVVSVLAPPSVDLGADRTECDSIILDAGPFSSFTWSTMETSKTIVVRTGGTYYVDVLDNNGCTGSDTVTVMIEESPVSAWSAIWTSAVDVQFTNASTPTGPGVTYLWDFGDGNSSTLQNPTHTYGIAGNYIVSLTVTTVNCGDDESETRIGTNLEDELFSRSITLFPNPSNGIFALGISGLEADELHITISDVTGKTIMEFHEPQRIIGNFEQVIDLTGHAEGVYMVTVFDGQRYARKKMIVR
jgi:hypothetical protein